MVYPIIIPSDGSAVENVDPDNCVMYVYTCEGNSLIERKIVARDSMSVLFDHHIAFNHVISFAPISLDEDTRVYDYNRDESSYH